MDDTLAVFHTHAVAGILGGILTGFLAEPNLCQMILPDPNIRGVFYGGSGLQLLKQLVGALCVVVWNVVITTLILFSIKFFTPLRMPDHELMIGDDAAHGEEAYALWGDGEIYDDVTRNIPMATADNTQHGVSRRERQGARGVTIQL